jgi:3-oxoacyl-[acyl-carrier-protein] synthase II
MTPKKVYVIGCETLSSLGFGEKQLVDALILNKSGVRPISQFEAKGLVQQNAAEVNVDLTELIQNQNEEWHEASKNDRKLELWVALITQFEAYLKELLEPFNLDRISLTMGLGANAFPLQNVALQIHQTDHRSIHQTVQKLNARNRFGANSIFNHSDLYAHYFRNKIAPIHRYKTILTACSSSTQSIANGMSQIMSGQVDLAIVGGTDSILNQFAYIAFGKLGVLTERTCMPFDINRSGAIAGECAGFAVLASEEALIKLNKSADLELVGFGNSLDAYKITAPDPTGAGVELAMKRAVQMAKISPLEINYINAHGTGTRSNDEVELRAIERLLGESSNETYVSSTKDRHGHCIAAAGILEFHVLLTAMKNNFIPSNLNLLKPIETSLKLPVISEKINQKIKFGMTNNFAFGGVNSSLIVKNHRA